MAGQRQHKYLGGNFPADNRYSSRIFPFPHLFNFYLDAAIEEIFQKQQKVTKIVIYADDIAMVLSKLANLDILEKVLSKYNLRINWEKSKQMYGDRNEKIEKVQTWKFLEADVKNSQKPFSVPKVRKTKLELLYNKFKWVPKKHPNTGIKVYNSYFKPVIDFFAERNPEWMTSGGYTFVDCSICRVDFTKKKWQLYPNAGESLNLISSPLLLSY